MHDENADFRNAVLNHFVKPEKSSVEKSPKRKSSEPVSENLGRIDSPQALAAHEQKLREQANKTDSKPEVEKKKPGKDEKLEDVSELLSQVLENANTKADELSETRDKVKEKCLDVNLIESMFNLGPK